MVRCLAGCALFVAVCALAACQTSPPNVLLITVDSLRADALSATGQRASTPSIDALAAAGVLFTQAVCDSPWTGASTASLLTGRSVRHHTLHVPTDRLSRDIPTLAEQFNAAGYQTAAVVSSFDLDHIFGLARGFSDYDDHFTDTQEPTGRPIFHLESIFYGRPPHDRRFRSNKLLNDSMKPGSYTTDAAIGWLRRQRAGKFFLWVHYFGGHERWTPGHMLPPQIAEYPRSIENTDAEIGRLLRWIVDVGLYRSTVIVLHGSQGQSLLDRGTFGHGSDLSEAAIRVPLIISGPKTGQPDRRVDSLVSLLDIAPTLFELAGIRPKAPLDGQSLLRSRDPKVGAGVYLETWMPATILGAAAEAGQGTAFGFVHRGWREEGWMYVRRDPVPFVDVEESAASVGVAEAQEELYDLTADPAEANNLAQREPARLTQMRDRVLRRVKGEE